MSKNRVPGTYKSKATFEPTTSPLPKYKDKALSDTRVRDEDYDYTKLSWPGHMGQDPNLSRGESLHVEHGPLVK